MCLSHSLFHNSEVLIVNTDRLFFGSCNLLPSPQPCSPSLPTLYFSLFKVSDCVKYVPRLRYFETGVLQEEQVTAGCSSLPSVEIVDSWGLEETGSCGSQGSLRVAFTSPLPQCLYVNICSDTGTAVPSANPPSPALSKCPLGISPAAPLPNHELSSSFPSFQTRLCLEWALSLAALTLKMPESHIGVLAFGTWLSGLQLPARAHPGRQQRWPGDLGSCHLQGRPGLSWLHWGLMQAFRW